MLKGIFYHPISTVEIKENEIDEEDENSSIKSSSTHSINSIPYIAHLMEDMKLDQRLLKYEIYHDNNHDSTRGICLQMDYSTIIILTITFVGDSSRGILFPVLWELCQYLGGNVVDLGYLVAMNSIGRLLVTTPYGYWCDQYRHRLPLLFSSFLLCLGAGLWANAYMLKRLYILYLAQLTIGFGTGTLGLTRSYAVERVEAKRRTQIIGLSSALQYAGFTISPVFGSIVSFYGATISNYWKYALPAYLVCGLSYLCLLGLITVFENNHLSSRTTSSSSSSPVTISMTREVEIDHESNRRSLIVGMILLNSTLKGSITIYETLGALILQDDYNFSIFAVGVLISIVGTIGTIQLLMFRSFWTRQFTDIRLILGGMATMIVAQLILLCYGSIPCMYRYVTGVFIMYSFGYPIGHTAVIGAFSKIKKSGSQAILMGWFATAGSISRIILPIFSGYLDSVIDNAPFCIALLILSISYVNVVAVQSLIRYYIDDQGFADSRDLVLPISSLDWLQIIFVSGLAIFSIFAILFLSPTKDGASVLPLSLFS